MPPRNAERASTRGNVVIPFKPRLVHRNPDIEADSLPFERKVRQLVKLRPRAAGMVEGMVDNLLKLGPER